jgi:hypothetical protein
MNALGRIPERGSPEFGSQLRQKWKWCWPRPNRRDQPESYSVRNICCTGYSRTALRLAFLLEYRRNVAIVENLWREVWKQPQNPDAIDRLVQVDFVITSGGRDIVGREALKAWVTDFQPKVHHFEFRVVETFQNQDGSRVASRWQITGRNNGLMGTEPNDGPFEMCGTAVWEVGTDGLLRHN